jgi:negative regulator of genetic competence, sporulation and motility
LEIKILQEEISRPSLSREQVLFFIHRFRKFDITVPEQRQRLVDSFINAVYHFDDKLVITFNYKESNKVVVLGEVVSAVDEYESSSDLSAVATRLEAL